MNGAKSTGDSKRIGWIDLAKGICIVLVVLSHVSNFVEVDYPLSVQARAAGLPRDDSFHETLHATCHGPERRHQGAIKNNEL